ncbi:carboxypeptidase-like regulatory domain-containing protein [Lentzea sp. BCCO 10_0856]|uniref:Carboxypeptidase-like regulatory domain-containing protein n=1 Tax=Lentzea miocenica TaxID=3095431 RepID=A0ABU4T2A2_9PSEU|nr:carboxypeptidase-like regulatory domain-containing protein [Lentzea sp. BCCO 10_0856]MDX8032282.1 carboxypeptidase-like regulatory domain-containing protein [Lentzea sp. BCCO 10_0856]
MTTAAVLAFGAATTGALAQEPETPTSAVEPTQTNEPSTPPSTTDPVPPSTTDPVPPSTTEPTTPPSTEPSTPAEPSTPTAPSTPTTPSTPDAKPEQDEKAVQLPANAPVPDLAVQVQADKAEFLPGEDIGVTVTVTNKSETVAANVRFGHVIQSAWLIKGADELSSRPSIVKGQPKVIRLVLKPSSPSNYSVPFQFRATVDGIADPTPGDNGTDTSFNVRQLRGDVSGVVYSDKNGNGAFDAGEGLANTWIDTRGGTPSESRTAYTDANGAFKMWTVPAGAHKVWSVDWLGQQVVQPGFADFVVEHGKETKIMVPVVAPVKSTLSATAAFDKESYAPADEVGLNITLKNSGTAPITGVVAVCQSYGNQYLTSAGWGALAPDGAGVTVPAGGETKVRVTDSVPKGLNFTTFYASCSFGNAGANDRGYAYAGTAYARVHGIFGRVFGKVVNATNNEPVRNTPVSVLDAVTRKPLKDVRTWEDGSLSVYDVPVGKVVFVVAGKWAPKDGKEFTADIVADTDVNPELQVVPSDVDVPAPAAHKPDFTVTAKFDKDSYDIGEPMSMHVTVKNVGTGYDAEVGLTTEWSSDMNEFEYDKSQLGEFADSKTVRLWPGESRELTLVGRAPFYLRDNKVTLKLKTQSWQDQNAANDTSAAVATVTFLKGDAVIVLYGDRNANGQRDAGEELTDTQVTVSGGSNPNIWKDGRTDASGRAQFRDLPIGVLKVWPYYKDGWVRHETAELTVSAGAESVLEVGAVRPLSDKLPATLRFAKREYAPGERYEAAISITNNTGADLPAVKAFCSGPGEAGEIYNSEASWGPLAWDGAGVSVPNGQTKVFHVSGAQPQEAARIGYATVACSIAPDPSDPGAAMAHDVFRVPGQHADAIGRLVKDDPNGGQEDLPVAGQVLVLVDTISKKVVTRTVTGEDGEFKVFNLPVGRYDVVVPGPWQVEYRRMNPYFHVRVGGETWLQPLWLVPGPEVEDPGYPLPEDQTPGTNVPPVAGSAGGSGSGDALAKTGASVLGLGVLGALLVAFGLGASVVGRRRQTA